MCVTKLVQAFLNHMNGQLIYPSTETDDPQKLHYELSYLERLAHAYNSKQTRTNY